MAIGAAIDIEITGDALTVLKELKTQFGSLNNKVDEIEKNVKDSFDGVSKGLKKNWTDIAIGFNQSLELVNKFSDAFSFTAEIKKVETDIKRFTGLVGSELDTAVSKAYRLGEVFDEDSKQIVAAANAMTKQLGGTFEDNLALIQKGFEKGANLNNDMLSQLREYGPQLKQSGLDGAQGLAIMAQAAKDGVYSDKAIDAIKEAGLSIREMGKNQIDALAGIGIKSTDLLGKSTFESMQLISKAMDGADEKAKQMVLADIFKGAGEDAGAGFIEGLSSIDLNIDNLPTVKQAGEGIRGFFADVKSWIGSTVGDMSPYLNTIGQLGAGIGGLLPLMKGMSIWNGIVAGAQWIWNGALVAGGFAMTALTWPVIAIGAAIAGLVAIVYYFGDFFIGFWEDLKGWFWGLVDFWNEYLNPFGWLIDLIDSVFPGAKKAIFDFFGSLWDGIYSMFIQPFVDAWEWIAGALGLGGEDAPEIKASVEHNVESGYNENMPFSPTKNTAGGSGGSGTNGGKQKGAGFASAEKKEVNTSIEYLVKNLTIQTSNLKESPAKIRQLISEALIGGVRDFEAAI